MSLRESSRLRKPSYLAIRMGEVETIGKRRERAPCNLECLEGEKEGTLILKKKLTSFGQDSKHSILTDIERKEKNGNDQRPITKKVHLNREHQIEMIKNEIIEQNRECLKDGNKNDGELKEINLMKKRIFEMNPHEVIENLRAKNKIDTEKITKDELICRSIWPWEDEDWESRNEKATKIPLEINRIAEDWNQRIEKKKISNLQFFTQQVTDSVKEFLDKPLSFYKGFDNISSSNNPGNQSNSEKLEWTSNQIHSKIDDQIASEPFIENYIIVDNQNKDMSIKVRDASQTLLSMPDKKFTAQPSNSIDPHIRECLYKSVPFINASSNSYDPVSLQGKNEDNPKRHFIKQKQAVANIRLKRSFGISYVKERESKQQGVDQIFKKIHPIVIQCSTMIEPYTEESDGILVRSIDMMIDDVFRKKVFGNFIVTVIPALNETDFRDYLLPDPADSHQKQSHIRSFCLETIEQLPLFFASNLFLSIPLTFDSSGFKPNISKTGSICLGIHMKKSLNSKNSYMHNIGREYKPNNQMKLIDAKIRSLINGWKPGSVEETYTRSAEVYELLKSDFEALRLSEERYPSEGANFSDNGNSTDVSESNTSISEVTEEEINGYLAKVMSSEGLNFNTLSFKLELYVPEEEFKKSSFESKKILTTIIHRLKKKFDGWLLLWSVVRHQLHSSNPSASTDLKVQLDLNKRLLESLRELSDPCLNFPSQAPPSISTLSLSSVKSYLQNNQSLYLKPCPFLELPTSTRDIQSSLKSLYSDFDLLPTPFNLPLYTVDTRDCFSFDPLIRESTVMMRGREVIKKEYFFDPDNVPNNFEFFEERFPDKRIGVVTYENYYSHEELIEIERLAHQTELEYFDGAFLPHTGQTTLSGKRVKRTKFFFGSRYLWSAHQLAEPHSGLAGGIRTDVSPIPGWMVKKVESPLVQDGIIPPSFVNSIAMNIYHDGEEGLGQHYDDAVRFRQVGFYYTSPFSL